MSNGFIENLATGITSLVVGGIVTWAIQTRMARVKIEQEVAAAEAKAKEAMKVRIDDLETQLAVMKERVVPISAAFQAVLVKQLTHFHTPVMDALLVKLGPPFSMTAKEEEELAAALKQRSADMGDLITESERNAALMLPYVIKRVREEIEKPKPVDPKIQVVAIPPPPKDGPK